MKLTPWFPPEVPPVHPGVYEVEAHTVPFYRMWDGRFWRTGDVSPAGARPHNPYLGHADFRWRGIQKD